MSELLGDRGAKQKGPWVWLYLVMWCLGLRTGFQHLWSQSIHPEGWVLSPSEGPTGMALAHLCLLNTERDCVP